MHGRIDCQIKKKKKIDNKSIENKQKYYILFKTNLKKDQFKMSVTM